MTDPLAELDEDMIRRRALDRAVRKRRPDSRASSSAFRDKHEIYSRTEITSKTLVFTKTTTTPKRLSKSCAKSL
jgi:hypothetical protein